MKIYHNPRCRKSRETLAIINEKGVPVEVVEYLKEVPSASDLNDILTKLGIPADQLLRKGEKVYKESFKGKNMSNDQWIKVMLDNPVLIERPIVVTEGKAVLGRPPENVLELL